MRKKKKGKSVEELLEEALVPEEEQPYEVPDNWVWVKMGYSVQINPTKPKLKISDEQICSFLPMGQVNPELGTINSLEERSFAQVKKGYTYFEENDILFAKITPCMENGNTVIANGLINGFGFGSTEFYVIRTPKQVCEKYIYFLLRSQLFRNQAKAEMTGAVGQQRVPKSFMENYPFPLPPLNEQKRIAEKVERLLNKIDEAKRLIQEAKETFELRWEAILDNAFRGNLTKKWRDEHPIEEHTDNIYGEIKGDCKEFEINNESGNLDLYPIPTTWRWIRLGDIAHINPPKKKLVGIEDQQLCTFIPMSAVSDNEGRIENPEIKPFSEVKKRYTFFLEGDILFAKITPCMENGKSAIAEDLINGFGFGSTEFHVIRTKRFINRKLLYYLFRSKLFREKAKREMTGAVGQQRVPKGYLEEYLFPLSPREEQDKIVELLDNLYKKEMKITEISRLQEQLELMRESILNKAFRGDLGTNDPSEENAVELLIEVLQGL